MTLVKFNTRSTQNPFNNLVDDFFGNVPSFLREDFVPAKNSVAVNIKETEKDYQLDIIAPGLNKEDFRINTDNNILTVEAERKATEENKNEKLIRNEYRFQSFKRSFTIDKNIDAENISAKYVNGVLTLNLPRKAEVRPAVKQISVQ